MDQEKLAEHDRRYARAFRDLEARMHDLKNCALVAELMVETVLPAKPDRETFAAWVGRDCPGNVRGYILTDEEWEPLMYALHQLGTMCTDLHDRYMAGLEGRAEKIESGA